MIYFFIHTPKTSGTTFMDVLSKDKSNNIGYFYPSSGEVYDFENTIKQRPLDHLKNNPDWKKFNVIAGHFTFGIHDIFKAEQFQYIAAVRDPESHYISTYKALLRMSKSYIDHLLPNNKNQSIHALLELEYSHNLQTFFLSGLSQEEIRNDKEKAYEVTIENINKLFAVIYPMERFDEALFYLKHKIGIAPNYYKRKNVGTNYLDPDIISGATDRIKEVNDVDFRIYRYVQDKFNEDLKTVSGITWQVKRFKLFNYLYGGNFMNR